jgi:hypothetical protein
VFASNGTFTNLVGTNVSAGTLSLNNTNITTATIGNLRNTNLTSSNAVFTNITTGSIDIVSITNSVPFTVQGNIFGTQSSNLTQWLSTGGSILASVNSEGSILVGNNMLFGRDTFYTDSTAGASTTSITFQTKTTATTPSLSAGDYLLQCSFAAGAGGANTGRNLETRLTFDATVIQTTGSVLANSTICQPSMYMYRMRNISNGIHTMLFEYRTTNSGTQAIVGDVVILLWRIV